MTMMMNGKTMMMNGTSTHVGDNTTYSSALRPGCGREGWASGMMCLWSNWSIQLFVLLGLILQTVLAVLGSRRKTSSAKPMRVVIWATYSLTSYISTLALGKLSSITLNKSNEEYNTELIALLAPLTLLLLGNPDSITAFSVEDNWLGSRRVLNLVITFPYVVWILARSWKISVRMILYFPMFVAGIIEYGETIWAVYSAYAENTKMTPGRVEKSVPVASMLVPHLDIFLKAYHRFNGLKPHLGDWLKNPYSMSYRSIPIDEYSPKDIFLITDMELGFTYDVLYTKAPVLYTKSGIMLRFISYFGLLLTLGGFIGLFLIKLLRDPYVIYTLGLLIGVVLRQTYQLLELFYSDWLIIMKWSHLENPVVLKFLKFLVERSLKKERWSNRIRQFNFLDYCQSDKPSWFFRITKVCAMAEKLSKYLATDSVPVPLYLKAILLEDMDKFETKRARGPFAERGEWTLGLQGSLDKLQWSIEMTFDRSIIIWHIATHICYYSCHEKSDRREASKLISDYMMFLLVRQRKVLSLTTVEITYNHAYTILTTFLKEGRVLEDLSGPNPLQESYSEQSLENVFGEGWNVLEEVRTLARELKGTENSWELISSVWVEMLCFAAYNCQQYHHMKLLRRGGEIITHVWLLLSHKTDKFKNMKDIVQNLEIESV